jgi:3-oxoacyl-[acyl-carrier protein] reductase
MLNSKLLIGQNCLITGSNRGIGKSTLELFASHGSDIIAHGRIETKEFSSFLINTEKKFKINVLPIFFDLSDVESIKMGLKSLINQKLKIDVLVNNAGIAHGSFFNMTSSQKLLEVFHVNFFSQILISQLVSKIMIKEKKGSIINIASITGLEPLPGYLAYGSSKAALIHATKILSSELARFNIRVNAIAPGLTNTDMAQQMESKAFENMVSRTSGNRLASPEEISNAILFFATDMSSFITGQVLRVDGGYK